MSISDRPKGIEPTELLAFSAWFAFHCIPIRKWDEHPLLRVLPWSVFLNAFPGMATPMAPFTDVMWSLATEVQF